MIVGTETVNRSVGKAVLGYELIFCDVSEFHGFPEWRVVDGWHVIV